MDAGSRGLGVTPQDLDAARLVFVSVKDAKPKRKVAVPIPENGNWDAFIEQVKTKLKLSGVGEIYLAATDERVLHLDQLQDIDELYVVEAAGLSAGGNGYAAGTAGGYSQRYGVADTEITPAMSSQLDTDADYDAKYIKRQSSVQRTMKRVFPSLFSQQSLPLTTKDTGAPLSPVEQVRRRIRRRRRSWTDPRTILVFFALMSCLATLAFVYLRAAHIGLP